MTQSDEETKDTALSASDTSKILSSPQDHDDQAFRKFHYYRLSETAIGSSESSPTTTISTVDDSSATEPSPGSSPESPPPATFAPGMNRPQTADDTKPFFELQKQPPPKKGRNLKGLAVNTARSPGYTTSSTPSLPLPQEQQIIAVSPSFVKPPTPQKRKPSNLGLTLLTPGITKAPPQEIKLAIPPPTPALTRPVALRHFQSSPSLPLAPQRIMIPQNPRMKPTLDTVFSPVNTAKQLTEEDEQNFDIPLSKEEKPEAYPEGPICVYEPYIDLYLEPTAEQCRQYDVVMNVASEVRNPLIALVAPGSEEPEIRIDGGGGIQYAPRRDVSPQAESVQLNHHESSPTTPKAGALPNGIPATDITAPDQKEPEYIHIKWEHNSDIVPDLLGLVKLIDERILQHKRILIHCQCGVSRSASLVVAYGLYKDPTLSVQEAYDAVKKRSKWIGPNMNLIMQLQEFRTSLQRGGMLSADRGHSPLTPSSALSEWGGPFSSRTIHHPGPLSASIGPLSASQTSGSPCLVSPGPSSAPSAFEWPLKNSPAPPPGQRARAISAVKPGSAVINTSGRVVPVVPALKIVEPESAHSNAPSPLEVVADSDSTTPTGLVPSAPTEEFAMTPLQPSPDVHPADSFGLMSPSSTEFASSPFDRSVLLAQLGMGSVTPEERPRRTTSLKTRSTPNGQSNRTQSSYLDRPPRLRGKISSPSIREQQQLQELQAKIEASLHLRQTDSADGTDEALMSPRATEFTQNPFALSLTAPTPPAEEEEGLSTTEVDPRSPAQKGVSPITRNILDVL